MKRLLAGSLSLALGWSTVLAEEVQWRAAAPDPPAVEKRAPADLGVSLGRPQPMTAADRQAIVDPNLVRTSFRHTAPAARTETAPQPSPLPDGMEPTATPPAEAIPPGPAFLADPGGPVLLADDGDTWEEFDLPPGPVFRPYPRFYASAEYLLWTIRDSHLPPLVTTGIATGGGVSGNLGGPGTAVLFGGSSVDNEEHSGARFTAGWWFGETQRWGVEGSFFFLGQRSVRFSESSAGDMVVARPFFNINNGNEDREVVAAPGLSAGRVDVGLSSRLWGAELNARRNLWSGAFFRADLIGGFRYLDLNERLNISENIQVFPTAISPFPGDQFFVLDQFGTRNRFYGGQIGASADFNWGRWGLNLRTKVALGDTHQVIRIAGLEQLTAPGGGVQSFPGGLLALPSNGGHFNRDRFAVVPEVGCNLSFQATSHLRLFVGYTFLFWSNVVRPGDQVDRVLDVSQVPNFPSPPPRVASRPAVPFNETGFWAQGVNFGLEFTY